jgi:hypothetical protein
MTLRWLAPLALLCLGTLRSMAQNSTTPIYNFQFKSNANGNEVAYTGTGALGYGGTVFNYLVSPSNSAPSLTFSNALTSFGLSSSVTLTVAGSGQSSWNSSSATTAGAPQTLLSSYLYDSNTFNTNASTFTLSNLQPNAAYILYLYAGDGYPETKGTQFAVTGGTAHLGINTTTSAQITSFAEGVNYVVFTGVTDATGNVAGTYKPNSSIGAFSGLQINVAPEPGSSLYLAGAAISIIGFYRRRLAP